MKAKAHSSNSYLKVHSLEDEATTKVKVDINKKRVLACTEPNWKDYIEIGSY
jgi:hypothetical protein